MWKSHKCHKFDASTGLFSGFPQISRLRSYVLLRQTSENRRILIEFDVLEQLAGARDLWYSLRGVYIVQI